MFRLTLNDIFHKIMNYNLENIGKDFVIPMIPVIFVIVIVPTLIIIIFFVCISIYQKFFTKKILTLKITHIQLNLITMTGLV